MYMAFNNDLSTEITLEKAREIVKQEKYD